MTPLTFPFTRGGYAHVLLARAGPWCIVQRTWIEDGHPHLPHFELVRLRPHPARQFPDGRSIPAGESYPTPRMWGYDAWSVPTLVHAHARWDSLRTTHPDLPPWDSLAIPDDPLGYEAWRRGTLPPSKTGP